MEHTIFESNSTKLSLDSVIGCLRLQIKGYINEEVFKDILTKALSHFPKLKVTKTLNDFREFKGTTPAMQKWVIKNYYPSLVKNGLTHGALVLNSDVFAKFAAKNVQDKASKAFDYEIFPSLEEAEDWLKKY